MWRPAASDAVLRRLALRQDSPFCARCRQRRYELSNTKPGVGRPLSKFEVGHNELRTRSFQTGSGSQITVALAESMSHRG